MSTAAVQQRTLVEIQQLAVELWQADQQTFTASETTARALGAALIEVKAAMPYGDYGKWLKRAGIDRNRANYCVRVSTGKVDKVDVVDKPPQFILTGCKPREYLHDELTRMAGDKPVATHVLNLLTTHVADKNAETPESRAWQNAKRRAALVERLQRIPSLGSEVIHATNWKERTVERLKRLLYIAKPPVADGLDGFLNMYEQVWGADKLPLKWVLGVTGYEYNIGNELGDHLAGIYKLKACTRARGEWALYVRTSLGEPPASYTDAVEAERILMLTAEQAEYEVLHPYMGRPPAIVTTSCAEAFPDDEPGFYVQEHKERIKATAADNARAAKIAREAAAAKMRHAFLDYFREQSKPLPDGRTRPPITLGAVESRFYNMKNIKRTVARLVKDGELRLLDGNYSLPESPAPPVPVQVQEVVAA